jgi:hypothetical protein
VIAAAGRQRDGNLQASGAKINDGRAPFPN